MPARSPDNDVVVVKWQKATTIGLYGEITWDIQEFVRGLTQQISNSTNLDASLISETKPDIALILSKDLRGEIEGPFKEVLFETRVGDKQANYDALYNETLNSTYGCSVNTTSDPNGIFIGFVFVDLSHDFIKSDKKGAAIRKCLATGLYGTLGLFVPAEEILDQQTQTLVRNNVLDVLKVLYDDRIKSGESKENAMKLVNGIILH